MELIRSMESWEEWPKYSRRLFQAFRTEEQGRQLLIDENAFTERILPLSAACGLTEQEMNAYLELFLTKDSRELLYRWPKELPAKEKLKDVWEIAPKYLEWLVVTKLPKLFFGRS